MKFKYYGIKLGLVDDVGTWFLGGGFNLAQSSQLTLSENASRFDEALSRVAFCFGDMVGAS